MKRYDVKNKKISNSVQFYDSFDIADYLYENIKTKQIDNSKKKFYKLEAVSLHKSSFFQ